MAADLARTATRLECALNGALLGRGITLQIIQRNYRLGTVHAMQLQMLRDTCFDVLGELAEARRLLMDLKAFIDPERVDYDDTEAGDQATLLVERIEHALGTCRECAPDASAGGAR